LERLAEAQARTEERVGQLEGTVARLAEAQARAEEQLAWLIETVRPMVADVSWLKGDALERRFRERAFAYLRSLIRRAHALSPDELDDLLDRAVEKGLLSEDEAADAAETDAVVRGKRWEDGAELYLVVEVSWGVGPTDVVRAARRAELLARTGILAWPVVAGKTIMDEAVALAREKEVWQVVDGRVMP
jgi:hypothetical protein